MHRLPPSLRAIATAVLLAGLAACATGEYYDTNAAVDARPECAGMGTERTGEPVPSRCQREQGMRWDSDSDDKIEVDFSDDD
ncbi:hypothetical protein H4F99_14180 [Lysobacter sp. SG-8]|uniref:Lipoprotein n=1 Tax=Marilutibacter penaei TaxID=2759900 RepID=A0A7W3U630_9GAMM|nr:hypothetical protein [Lysobacter penaei]MBB1089629.1 hypothetical protein [Lysobacter penaei]